MTGEVVGLVGETISIPQQRRRLGFFAGRRTAQRTVTPELLPITAEATTRVEDREALFGLEEEFTEYHRLWQAHRQPYDEFVRNPTVRSQLQQVVLQQSGGLSRDERRRRGNWRPTLTLETLADLARLNGRQAAFATSRQLFDWETSSAIHKHAHTLMWRGHSLFKGVLAGKNTDDSPEAAALQQAVKTLSERSRETYRPILSKGADLNWVVESKIADSLGGAAEFLDTLLSCADSEAVVDRTFVVHFANDLKMRGDKSILAKALRAVHEQAGKGHMAEAFIDDLIAENGGDNAYAFFGRQFEVSGKGSFRQMMLETLATWPSDLAEEYRLFAAERIRKYSFDADKVFSRFVRKDRLYPRADHYFELAKRAFLALHGEIADEHKDKLDMRDKLAADTDHFADAQTGHDAVLEGELTSVEPLQVVRVLMNGNQTRVTSFEGNAVETFIGNRPQDASFVEGVKAILKYLRTDPLGPGITALKNKKLLVNNKRLQVYSAKPEHMRQLKVGDQRAKDSRIVYVRFNGSIGLIGICKNHGDYDLLCDKLV